MSFFLICLTVINTLAIAYLIYLFYTKKTLKPALKETVISGQPHKIKLTKFNPFNDLGGEHSFILTILDSHDDGIILTSLHHRDNTRIYAKPIKSGEGDNVSLSKEEKSAIVKTIKS